MAKQLDSQGKALLSILVQVLRDADPNDPATFITYTETVERLGLPHSDEKPDWILSRYGFDSLVDWVVESGFPPIMGLIVRKIERMPGPGFFKLYGKREPEDFQWWLAEIGRCRRFDWSPYLDGVQPSAVAINSTTQNKPSGGLDLFAEAQRIANLIWDRVAISGEQVQRTAPERSAPADLVSNIHKLLQASPLVCYLCRGVMQIKPANRLFQPSPDRIDSSLPDYGLDNLCLAHLACNLGKNASSVAEFDEWLNLIRSSDSSIPRN